LQVVADQAGSKHTGDSRNRGKAGPRNGRSRRRGCRRGDRLCKWRIRGRERESKSRPAFVCARVSRLWCRGRPCPRPAARPGSLTALLVTASRSIRPVCPVPGRRVGASSRLRRPSARDGDGAGGGIRSSRPLLSVTSASQEARRSCPARSPAEAGPSPQRTLTIDRHGAAAYARRRLPPRSEQLADKE
jgi:hypothetical protein